MDLSRLSWRLFAGTFIARAFLCPTCWAKLEEYEEGSGDGFPSYKGEFVLTWSSALAPKVRIKFQRKGYEEVDVDCECSLCGESLAPTGAEEVNFYAHQI